MDNIAIPPQNLVGNEVRDAPVRGTSGPQCLAVLTSWQYRSLGVYPPINSQQHQPASWPRTHDPSEGVLDSVGQSIPNLPPPSLQRPQPTPPHITSTLNPKAPSYSPGHGPSNPYFAQGQQAGINFNGRPSQYPTLHGQSQPCFNGQVWHQNPIHVGESPPQTQQPVRQIITPSLQPAPTIHVRPAPTFAAPRDHNCLVPPIDTSCTSSLRKRTDDRQDSGHPSTLHGLSPISVGSAPNKNRRSRSRSRNPSIASSHRTVRTCTTCNKDFQTNASLRRHERNHKAPEEKQFACEHCEVRFIWKKDLVRHEASKRHRKRCSKALGPALLDCEVTGCDKVGEHGFARRDHLERHVATVHSGKGRVGVQEARRVEAWMDELLVSVRY